LRDVREQAKGTGTVEGLPQNSAANRSGSGCPVSDSAASRSPAAQNHCHQQVSATAGWR